MDFPPVFLQRIRDAFAERVRYDQFYNRVIYDPRPRPSTPSIRVLISRLVRAPQVARRHNLPEIASFPVFDLSMTIQDLASVKYRLDNGEVRNVGQVLGQTLCLDVLPQLRSDAFLYSPSSPASVAEFKLMMESLANFLGVDERDVMQALSAAPYPRELAEILFEDLMRLVGSRQLSSFYRVERDEDGWFANGPALFTCFGQPLKDHEVQTSHGLVTVKVSRYLEDTGALTRPYEWQATLQADPKDPGSPILTYACGMVYVGPRYLDDRDTDDLLAASDAVADVDVLQVRAFLDHDGSDEIWLESDLCFVWLWERAEIAAKGAGAACLKAAISDLKTRFRSIHTVILDCQPMQLITDRWSSIDPPEIEEARLDATTRLHGYITDLHLETAVKGEVVFISNIHHDDPEAALLALA